MKALWVLLSGSLALGATAGAYFGFRSREKRLYDKDRVIGRSKQAYQRTRKFCRSLIHTESAAA